MPYHNSVKHPLNFIYLSCLLDRGLIRINAILPLFYVFLGVTHMLVHPVAHTVVQPELGFTHTLVHITFLLDMFQYN